MKQAFTASLVSVLAGALVGCGGEGATMQSSTPMVTPVGAQSSATVINISDAPSDRLIGFELTVNSVTLTKSDGTSASVLTTPRRVELTHLAGTTEALVLSALPQGTYINAVVAVSDPEVTFINNAGQPVEKVLSTFTTTVTVPIGPPLVVGTAPVVLTFDVNAQNSVAIDLTSGNITVTPAFTLSSSALPPAGHEGEEDADDGEFEHIVGQVTAVSANSFTIKVGQSGLPLSFTVNSSTRFEDGATFASVVVNSLVRVEGVTQPDGSALATDVELVGANLEQETEGVITAVSGNPVSSFSVALQDGSGGMITTGMLGSSLTVQITPATDFRLDNGNIDLGGMSLPPFSAASLSKAQRVEADGALANGVLSASRVKLEQQALTGTISAFSNSQFTLTVPSDSAFTLLTGMTSVSVFTGRSTSVDHVSLTNGTTVKVRGLLLLSPSQGSYILVASRVTNP